jgi:thiamine-monophosphate kinase
VSFSPLVAEPAARDRASVTRHAARSRRPARAGEFVLIETLRRRFASSSAFPAVLLGIGDDAALVRSPRREKLVLTVDACVEHVHFERAWLAPQDIGYRALMAAASDLAAMAAAPLAALTSWEVPLGMKERELDELARGQARAAQQLAVPMVGGNISRAQVLGLHTTLIGRAERPILRRGARAGDELWLIGNVGMAAAGLRVLEANCVLHGSRACVQSWRRPRALIDEARDLVGRARALIDVSDGLAADAEHLAAASGVRLVIDGAQLASTLPRSLRETARGLAVDPLQLALHGGEDYCLLATGPAERRPAVARVIGEVAAGRGVVLRGEGTRQKRVGRGFDHLRR